MAIGLGGAWRLHGCAGRCSHRRAPRHPAALSGKRPPRSGLFDLCARTGGACSSQGARLIVVEGHVQGPDQHRPPSDMALRQSHGTATISRENWPRSAVGGGGYIGSGPCSLGGASTAYRLLRTERYPRQEAAAYRSVMADRCRGPVRAWWIVLLGCPGTR